MGGKVVNVQSMMHKTLKQKRPKLFDMTLQTLNEKYHRTVGNASQARIMYDFRVTLQKMNEKK